MTPHRPDSNLRLVRDAEEVRVKLLGGFEMSVGGRILERDRARSRVVSLIKMLALAPTHRLYREEITDALWPELDSTRAINNLHRTLHHARKLLDARHLTLNEGIVSLCPDDRMWTDVEAFEEATTRVRRGGDAASYQTAISLYTGELLPEDRYEDWADERRRELKSLYVSLLVEVAALYEERGDYDSGIEALRLALSEELTNEEAHMSLMRLHALGGRKSEAMSQYDRLGEVLSKTFGTGPGSAARQLYEEIRFDRLGFRSTTATMPAAVPSGNIPLSLTSFIGREMEIVEVKRLLWMTRLMTLVGAGGSGKTRLALETARDLSEVYPDGVWLVELAPLTSGIAQTVATVLDVPEQPGRPPESALADLLRDKDLLLVLDNCEHLVDETAKLARRLLGECPKLKILATSREPVGVPGEVVWTVPPLSLPNDGAETEESMMRSEAVRLFVDRTRSRLPDFELTKENAVLVARVCRKLDGIPLAIELATARMRVMVVEQIADRLDDSLGLLVGADRTVEPRHRTMRATLEWSYDLLPESERTLLRRLAVFAGGWTLEASEVVTRSSEKDSTSTLDLLSRLVDKSLVLVERRTEPRYRMLEPVRQFALELLSGSGEWYEIHARHAGYYLSLTEAAEEDLIGPNQIERLEQLASDYANLRAALAFCLEDDNSESAARTGLRLAASLGRFWGIRGSGEGREWLEKGLARSVASPPALRAKALREAGFIAVYHVDDRAMEMLEESLTLYKSLGDETGQATTLNFIMHAVGILGRHERMPKLRREAEALLSKPPKDRRATAYLLLSLGMMGMVTSDHTQLVRLEEALALFREAGDVRAIAMCLTIMGIAALSVRDEARAAAAFEETLGILKRLRDKTGTFYSLTGAAGVAVLRDQPVRAARLFGAAEALRESIEHPAQPLKRVNYDDEKYLATVRRMLDNVAFDEAFSEGRAMSPERAIDLGLSTEREPRPRKVSGERPTGSRTPLTHREQDVALLIAQGFTNHQIASELCISKNTVASHVAAITRKLNVHSRSRIAVWVTERRLTEAPPKAK